MYPKPVTLHPVPPHGGRATHAVGALPGTASDEGTYAGGAEVAGWSIVLHFLGAFLWWWPGGGRITFNRGKRGLTRTTRGLEDITGRTG